MRLKSAWVSITLLSAMNYKVGITGNYYYTAGSREQLVPVCESIGKAPSSIYWNAKYNVYVIRIKSKQHKRKVKQLQRSGG